MFRDNRGIVSGGLRFAAAVACGAATLVLAASLARHAPAIVAITVIVAILAGAAAALRLGRPAAADEQPEDGFAREERPVPAEVEAATVPLALTTGTVVRIPLSPLGTSLAPIDEVLEPVAELVRAVRDMAPPVKLIQVTSPLSGEGKTTVAARLAAALAHDGRRVLLIDAHHGRHRAHLLLDAQPVASSPGLPVEAYIAKTRFPDVDLLRVGDSEDNGTPPLAAVTWDLVREYDWTLLDTAGGVSRALPELVVRADLNILVARADHTPAQLIEIARARLNLDPMIVVINADSATRSRAEKRAAARLAEP
jgi:Mrp family chromosome partitioning ATPase